MCEGLTAPPPDRSKYSLDKSGNAAAVRGNLCGKACTHVGGHTIWINPKWWSGISSQGRAFALAHELAHVEGITSETEADKRGGAIMCGWGYTRGVTEKGAREVVRSRPDAAQVACTGWDAMKGHK